MGFDCGSAEDQLFGDVGGVVVLCEQTERFAFSRREPALLRKGVACKFEVAVQRRGGGLNERLLRPFIFEHAACKEGSDAACNS